MNLSELTILTASFNNNVLTCMMLQSFQKQVGKLPEVVIIDNGTSLAVSDEMKSVFTVIDNFQHKILEDEHQPSKNHCKSIDYVIKNCIKTKWVLLVDNDVLFLPTLRKFLEEFTEDFDCAGEIGWDMTPPNRLFPYFCLINVEKFKEEQKNYYDPKRIIKLGMERYHSSKHYMFDTGCSFYQDIKASWKIKKIKLKDVCKHLKSGTLRNKNLYEWLSNNKHLIV